MSRPSPSASTFAKASPSPLYERRRRSRQWWSDWTLNLIHGLRARYWLRVHVFMIALLMLGGLMLGGLALRAAGVESLALRYALLLPAAYLGYLGLLRLWAHSLLRGRSPGDTADVPADLLPDLPAGRTSAADPFASGGGGDFGGGGASGDFGSDLGTDALLESAGALDEGAVLAVPLLLIGAIGLALGATVFALFGVEVLLAVAVEVAVASVAGGMAWRQQREGWWRCAVRRTWPAALGLMVLGVLMGAAVDTWLPEARSLLHAWHLIRVV